MEAINFVNFIVLICTLFNSRTQGLLSSLLLGRDPGCGVKSEAHDPWAPGFVSFMSKTIETLQLATRPTSSTALLFILKWVARYMLAIFFFVFSEGMVLPRETKVNPVCSAI